MPTHQTTCQIDIWATAIPSNHVGSKEHQQFIVQKSGDHHLGCIKENNKPSNGIINYEPELARRNYQQYPLTRGGGLPAASSRLLTTGIPYR